MQCDHIKAQTHYQEALTLWKELGDMEGVAIALSELANLLYHYGDLATARSMCDEALSLSRELGSITVTDSMGISAKIALSQGNLVVARELSEEVVTRFREMNHKWAVASHLSVLALVEAQLGNHDKANHHFEVLLPLVREVDDKVLTALILERLAGVVIIQGESVWATHLLGAAESLRQSIGISRTPTERRDFEQTVAAARTHLGEQAFKAVWDKGRKMPYSTHWELSHAQLVAAKPPSTV